MPAGRRAPLPLQGGVVPQFQQHAQLFVEEGVVIRCVVAEQRVGLDERAAPGDDLGAAAGYEIQGGELFEEPHRVLGGEHGYGSAQPQVGGLAGNRSQHYFGGGQGEVAAVVLAQAQEAEARLVGKLGQPNDLFQPLVRRLGQPGLSVAGQFTESKNANVHIG